MAKLHQVFCVTYTSGLQKKTIETARCMCAYEYGVRKENILNIPDEFSVVHMYGLTISTC